MKKLSVYFLSAILFAGIANAAPPLATMPKPIVDQSQDEVLDVMSADEMESRIQGTYQEPEHEPAPAAQEFTPPSGNTPADLAARLAYTEEQMRKLSGQINQLQFELKNVSAQAASAAQVAQTAQATAAASTSAAAAAASTPLADASQQYIARPGDVNGKYVIKVDGSQVAVDGEGVDSSAAPVATEESDFNAGVALISEQNLPAAKKKFGEFLATYPTSAKVADAYFWLGEISMDESSYKEGALNYLKSYKADKQGKRAEEALLKSSIALGKLGKKDEACRNLTTLKNVEGLQDLIKEQATSEAIKLGCK